MSIISYQKQPHYPFVIAAVSSLMDMYNEFLGRDLLLKLVHLSFHRNQNIQLRLGNTIPLLIETAQLHNGVAQLCVTLYGIHYLAALRLLAPVKVSHRLYSSIDSRSAGHQYLTNHCNAVVSLFSRPPIKFRNIRFVVSTCFKYTI